MDLERAVGLGTDGSVWLPDRRAAAGFRSVIAIGRSSIHAVY